MVFVNASHFRRSGEFFIQFFSGWKDGNSFTSIGWCPGLRACKYAYACSPFDVLLISCETILVDDTFKKFIFVAKG